MNGNNFTAEAVREQREAGVTDEVVDAIGSALYIYWNDVTKRAQDTYRGKVRAALQSVWPVAAEPVAQVDDLLGEGNKRVSENTERQFWSVTRSMHSFFTSDEAVARQAEFDGANVHRLPSVITAEPSQVVDSGRVTDDRVVFEQWVSKRHAVALDRWADSGKYRYDNTNAWWECWQAALAAQEQCEAVACGYVAEKDLTHLASWSDEARAKGFGSYEGRISAVPYGNMKIPVFLHAASPAGVPDGWVLVPRESTEAMRQAGAPECGYEEQEAYALNDVWKAMLDAAPSAPEGDGGEK